MITTLNIERFKSLRKLSIELGTVNVFIGPNGSGKTAILEALGLIGCACTGHVDDSGLLERGVRPGVSSLFVSGFPEIGRDSSICVETKATINGEKVSYSIELDQPDDASGRYWRFLKESVGHIGLRGFPQDGPEPPEYGDKYTGLAPRVLSDRSCPPDARTLLSNLADYVLYSPNTPSLRGTTPDYRQRPPVGLEGGRLAEPVQALKQFYETHPEVYPLDEYIDLLDWVSPMGVGAMAPSALLLSPSVPSTTLTVGFTDRFMDESRHLLTAYDASEGALYVLLLAVLALHPGVPPIFAIDNFDQALNPRLARAVTKLLVDHIIAGTDEPQNGKRFYNEASPPPEKRHRRQVLLTTHSPQVLDGLDISRDDVRLFAVDRNSKGETAVRRIVIDEKVLREAESGVTLSRLWVMGRLGGVPNV